MLNFKDIKFPLKVKDIHKIEKKKKPSLLVCLVIKIKKTTNLFIKKMFAEKHVALLLIEEKRKRHYVLIKDFSAFMYNHTVHRRTKYFYRYCLQAFSTEEILKTAL